MSSSRQAEDLLLLSLSLSQPLPTDHYTPASFGLNKIMAGLESDSCPASQLGRIGTPGTSGDDGKSGSGSGVTPNSSGSDPFEKKKVKKKKKKKAGECLFPEIIPEDDMSTGLACPQPISPIKVPLFKSEIIPIPIPTASAPTARPRSPDLYSISERWPRDTTSDAENVEKESIIVEAWDDRWAEERTEDLEPVSAAQIGSLPSENDMPTLSSEAVPSEAFIQTSPRRATPMQVRRPAPTLLDEFPALMNIPNLIPSGIGISGVPLPSLRDVKAAGRATAKAGIALVETVKDEYLTRIIGEAAAPQSFEKGKARSTMQRNSRSGKAENPRSPHRASKGDMRHRRKDLATSSDSDNDVEGATSVFGLNDEASDDNLDGDSDDEVLIDLDEAEGLTETWKGSKGQPSEAALGHGWTKWRSCKWEYVNFPGDEERRLLVNINPTPQTALQVIDCGPSNSVNAYPSLASSFNMLHPETIDLANSTILQTSPAEILHIPRQYSRTLRQMSDDTGAHDLQRAFDCETLEVMAGVDPGLDVLDEDNHLHLEEVLVDCALWRNGDVKSGHHALKWLILTQKRSARSYSEHGDGCAKPEAHPVYLNVLDVNSQRVETKVLLGAGRGGQILSSPQSVVITLAGNAPSIHFLCATTLKPILRPISTHIGLNSRTGLPVIALSGRLFSYTTMDARPRQPVQRGSEDMKLGTMVTATSNQAFYSRQQQSDVGSTNGSPPKPNSNSSYPIEGPPSMQSMVLNTAAGLGSEMAKGMWTGLKGLSTAAINGASKSETLSKGAPAFSTFAQKYASTRQHGGAGIKANIHGNAPGDGFDGAIGARPQTQSRFPSGSWIKVLDLGSNQSRKLQETYLEDSKKKGKNQLSKPIIVVHFALPATEVIAMPHPTVRPPGIDALSFSPGGTSLALGTTDGRSSFVVEIRPTAIDIAARSPPGDEPTGTVWLRYELRRGVTPAIVEKMEWSACSGWIGVGTRRTIHVFAIHPLGGRVSSLQIKSSRPRNLQYIPALSTKIPPVLRIRRPRGIIKRSVKASTPPSPSASSNVSDTSGTLRKSAYRVPARLFCFGPSVSTSAGHATGKKATSDGVLRTVDVFDPMSNILRSEAVYALRDNPVSSRSGAQDGTASKEEELKLASLTFRAWKVPNKPYHLHVFGQTLDTRSLVTRMRSKSLAHAEIHTHSTSTQVVPRPIYRENWLRFESIYANPAGLRTQYRFRITVDPCAPGQQDPVADFARPLAKAIQSELDLEQSAFVIPAYPNGAGKEPSRWQSSIGAFVHAKDIIRMRRKDSRSTSTSVTTGTAGTTPASYDEHLIIDDGTGTVLAGNEGGINDPEDMTTGSTSGDTRDDEWDDDLVTGAMDDEWHGAVPNHPHSKGMNKPREIDNSKKNNKY
ncbi:hypothetical protein QFC21_002792 [Naganishia friedmannii]|uniref:Uncharacterized protein n=1 Tax=Naganishia friedmannii TaxID=89922 RepID=A0ACC2VVC3_9TREE|nr:hypothetical protein QFC21_002792 [Naganishia friedmannii]